MTLANNVPFPFMQRLKPNYPFNNLKGKLCSGVGLDSSRVTDKENSLHLMLVGFVSIYLVQICFYSFKTKRFFNKMCKKGSGACFNKSFRYNLATAKVWWCDFRRNFLNYDDTRFMLLVFIFSTLISRWVMYKGFIHTDWFSGPQQFAAQQILYFLLDLYIMMYCPFKWIRNSTKNNWAGWAKIKPGKQKKFFYVHKPDPREELKKMGYFKKSGKNSNSSEEKLEPNMFDEENDQMYGQHFEMERGVQMKIQNFKKLLVPPVIQILLTPPNSPSSKVLQCSPFKDPSSVYRPYPDHSHQTLPYTEPEPTTRNLTLQSESCSTQLTLISKTSLSDTVSEYTSVDIQWIWVDINPYKKLFPFIP